MTLGEARSELRSIINELKDIENGIRNDFDGIGEEYCADCVSKIAQKYENVLYRLNRVDTNKLADWVTNNT